MGNCHFYYCCEFLGILFEPPPGKWSSDNLNDILADTFHSRTHVLHLLQRRVLIKEEKVPPELKHDMDKEKFEKSRQYALDKNTFELVQSQFDLIVSTVSKFTATSINCILVSY